MRCVHYNMHTCYGITALCIEYTLKLGICSVQSTLYIVHCIFYIVHIERVCYIYGQLPHPNTYKGAAMSVCATVCVFGFVSVRIYPHIYV